MILGALDPDRLRPDTGRLVAVQLRALALRMAAPCDCARSGCTTYLHAWHATRDAATPGPKAQTFEATPVQQSATTSATPTLDPPILAHGEYRELLALLANTASDLQVLLNDWNPNRAAATTTDEHDWCAHHLDLLGTCEPRYRGDLCRRCYELERSVGGRPTLEILEAWHHGRRVTDAMVHAARPKTNKKKKRRR